MHEEKRIWNVDVDGPKNVSLNEESRSFLAHNQIHFTQTCPIVLLVEIVTDLS